jgi:GntR family transcriptional regulator, rspAB operon transcriptional repressor
MQIVVPSKAERVYRELRRRIRELALPPGAPLRKEELAAELGVSRAPVSEAIARLADEALVDVYPRYGSFVAPIRAQDVQDALFVRTALETEAIRWVTRLRDRLLIARLEANIDAETNALAAGNLALFYDLDEALHAAIFEALAAPRAQRLLEAARAPLDRPRLMALPEAGRAEATLAEHRRIVAAIATGDEEYAAAAMRAHLAKLANSAERAMSQIEGLEPPA